MGFLQDYSQRLSGANFCKKCEKAKTKLERKIRKKFDDFTFDKFMETFVNSWKKITSKKIEGKKKTMVVNMMVKHLGKYVCRKFLNF